MIEAPLPAQSSAEPPTRSSAAIALWCLFALACLYTARLASDFLLPIGVAVLLKLVFDPVVRRLRRWRVPEAVGAALVLIGFLSALGYGVASLAHPAAELVANLPSMAHRLETKLRPLTVPVERVKSAGEQVEKLAALGSAKQAQDTPATPVPASGGSPILRTVSMLATLAVTLLLLYFLLASGDLILRKMIRVLPRLQDKKRAVLIAGQIEHEVSVYLFTISAVNLGFGVAVGLAMWGLGMPNPVLWGALAAVTNYLPYLGPVVCGGGLTAVALLTFDHLGTAMLVPAAFLALHALESYLVTPFVVGRRLTLNPLAIFLGVAFWGWLWGVPGALLAVPFLAICKIFCDHVPALAPVGEFLGR